MQGPQWLLTELLGGAGPPEVLGGSLPSRAALQAYAGVVDQIRGRKAEVDALGQRIALDLAEVQRVHQGYADERRQVQILVEQLQATLKGIDRRLAGYLEAERVRAEAARRAAYAGYVSGVGSVQSWLQAGAVARAAVRWALAQVGDPYRWGAAGPDAFDCSGLTSAAYRVGGDRHPADLGGAVERRSPRGRGEPAPGRPGVLRRRPPQPGDHPPCRHVHRQRADGARAAHR
jgi:hypothetical protein